MGNLISNTSRVYISPNKTANDPCQNQVIMRQGGVSTVEKSLGHVRKCVVA